MFVLVYITRSVKKRRRRRKTVKRRKRRRRKKKKMSTGRERESIVKEVF